MHGLYHWDHPGQVKWTLRESSAGILQYWILKLITKDLTLVN